MTNCKYCNRELPKKHPQIEGFSYCDYKCYNLDRRRRRLRNAKE